MRNVLSLFDGVSCGQVALTNAGVKFDQYYASEIEKNAMRITQHNFPRTIQLGDVTKVTPDMYSDIDLLIGGSPCTDLSIYKTDRGDRTGLEGSKSGLFYHFARIFKETNPKYFLFENVPMSKEWEDVITELLGVKPILINSNLVAAADRKRLYWTNIPGVTQPEDKHIFIKDIVEKAEDVPDKYWYDKPFTYNGDDAKVQCTLEMKGHRHMKEVYNLKGKCSTLTTCNGGNLQKKVYQDGRCRKFMPIEYERMMNLPECYTQQGFDTATQTVVPIADTYRYSTIGNGWTVDVIAHILSFLPQE